MKTTTHLHRISLNPRYLFLLVIMFIGIGLYAQVDVDFSPRRSAKAPAPYTNVQNYELQGDFIMIGNSNLTRNPYVLNEGNGNSTMIFVDIDGDPDTRNSSSAELDFPNPGCTEIIYAGLYWSGRGENEGTGDFTIGNGSWVALDDPGNPINAFDLEVGHNEDFENSRYSLTISRQGSGNNRYPRYEISGPGLSTYYFEVTNSSGNDRVRYQIGSTSGSGWINLPATYNVSGSVGTAVLDNPFLIEDQWVKIWITELVRPIGTNSNQNTYRNNSYIHYDETGNISYRYTGFDKRRVFLKEENDSYIEVVANGGWSNPQISYPTGSNRGYMYAAYADVTDYVRTHGVGNYFVADIATATGNGGGTGYYGGWGMVVVYQDPGLPRRNITVFDGYGYMAGSTVGSHTFDISGFQAVQTGNVNITMGFMAGEGDYNIDGDYFQIRNAADNAWRYLDHDGEHHNSGGNYSGSGSGPKYPPGEDNFFASVIQNTQGLGRNPDRVNNYGIDINMFNLNNTLGQTNNYLIANNQTSTRFRFGSNQDTYVIFNITFAVDAFIPEVVGENNVQHDPYLNGDPNITVPNGGSINPGDQITFTLELLNKGNEPSVNTEVKIKVPFNMYFIDAVIDDIHNYDKNSTNSSYHWEPPVGAPAGATQSNTPGGFIVWDLGYLPLHANTDDILGAIDYTFELSDDCFYMLVALQGGCAAQSVVSGRVSGEGQNSGEEYNNPLVTRYEEQEGCEGPVFEPFTFIANIVPEDVMDCDQTPIPEFTACEIPGNLFDRSIVEAYFPGGTKFYSSPPDSYDDNTDLVTGDFPVSPVPGNLRTYYAVVPGMDDGCYVELIIGVAEECYPEIRLRKSHNLIPGGDNCYEVEENDQITYIFKVDNTGLLPLENVQLTDPMFGSGLIVFIGGDNNNNGFLDSYEVWEYQATYTVTSTDIANGYIENQAYVSAEAPDETVVFDYSGLTNNDDLPTIIHIKPTCVTEFGPVSCKDGSDGWAKVTASGGAGNYSYEWSNGQTSHTAVNLSAGTYSVTVTDDEGCTTICSVTITEPVDDLSCTISLNKHVNCYNGSDGSATVTGSAGTAPYSFEWDDGSTNATNNNLTVGLHTVTITDFLGCISTCTIIIEGPAEDLSCGIVKNKDVSCKGGSDGSATVSGSGGTSPYTYEWLDDNSTSATRTNLSAGTYFVEITDANGCTNTCQVTITEPAEDLSCGIVKNKDVSCKGGSDGSATVSGSGGTSPYTYEWLDDNSTSATRTNLSAGTYFVEITDANGCTNTCQITITEPAEDLSCGIVKNKDVSCKGGSDGSATVSGSGGTSPYTYT